MKSSANDGTSLSRLLNLRLFPSLVAVVAIAVSVPNLLTYFSLKGMIPPERIAEARHTALLMGMTPMIAMGISVAACVIVALIVHLKVTKPTMRLARWAEERHRGGEGPEIQTDRAVAEIRKLAEVFTELFDEQLRRVSELRTLVGSTRHDISNHLTDISSTAQFQYEGTGGDPKVAAARTMDAVRTITHIIDTNAEITKNYCNIRGPAANDVRPRNIVHDCLDQLETDAFNAGVSLDAEIPPSSYTVVAHRALLERVIRNVTGNAIKYTPRGGSVSLAVRGDDDGLTIEVRDTGIGIPDEDKPHVFEREYRSKAVRGFPGTGYGLAAVDSVVAFYKGTVRITDNKPQGTIFTIRLPLKPTPPAPLPEIITMRHPAFARIPLFPRSDSGWVYALLVTIPSTGIFAAILFYEWFGNTPALADTTLIASYYVGGYSIAVILGKAVWQFIQHKPKFALSRLMIAFKTFVYNALAICGYLALRFVSH